MTSKYLLHATILIAVSVLFWQLYPAQAEDEFIEKAPDLATLQAIQAGGLVLYFRHGRTDTRIPDNYPVDYQDCSKQRPLSAEGITELNVIASRLAKLNYLQAREIIVSPFCRTRETADILFPDHPKSVDVMQMYTAMLTEGEKAPVIARTRELLTEPVPPGENRVVVAHAPNLAEVMGYFPEDAHLVVIRPQPATQDFEYVATVSLEDWDRLVMMSDQVSE